MPQPIPVPFGNIILVVHKYELHGQVCLNTYHYSNDDAIADWEEVAAGYLQSFETNVHVPVTNFQSHEVDNYVLSIQVLTIAEGRTRAIFRTPTVQAGVDADDSLPTSSAAVITKVTQFAGAANRGRTFLAGIPFGAEDQSRLTPVAIGKLNAVANGIASDLEAAGPVKLNPGLWNGGTAGNAFKPIQAGLPRNIIRVQRRREVGRGI